MGRPHSLFAPAGPPSRLRQGDDCPGDGIPHRVDGPAAGRGRHPSGRRLLGLGRKGDQHRGEPPYVHERHLGELPGIYIRDADGGVAYPEGSGEGKQPAVVEASACQRADRPGRAASDSGFREMAERAFNKETGFYDTDIIMEYINSSQGIITDKDWNYNWECVLNMFVGQPFSQTNGNNGY